MNQTTTLRRRKAKTDKWVIEIHQKEKWVIEIFQCYVITWTGEEPKNEGADNENEGYEVDGILGPFETRGLLL